MYGGIGRRVVDIDPIRFIGTGLHDGVAGERKGVGIGGVVEFKVRVCRIGKGDTVVAVGLGRGDLGAGDEQGAQ